MQPYFKQIILDEVGLLGQQKLLNAKVLLVGLGGLGCPSALYLASCGVGTIGIVEFDKVDISNLHRQILYNHTHIGCPKIEVGIAFLQAQFPTINFIAHNYQLNAENVQTTLSDYDLIIDGSDNFATRYLVNDTCVKLNIPLLSGSVLGFKGQLALFSHPQEKNLRSIFPEPPAPEDTPNCSENGILGSVTGIMGSMMAHMAISYFIGLQKPKEHNKLRLIDFKTLRIQCIEY